MAIGVAIQRGHWVYVYDDSGRTLFSKFTGGGKGDGLKGYTGSTVSIQVGFWLYTYDLRGKQVARHFIPK